MPKIINSQHYSFWEKSQYFDNIHLIIIGSGIVGLNAAISYKEKFPKHKVLVLERGILPYGASTKNAGFACFGSPSELLDDLKKTDESNVWETVEMRFKGLELLKKNLGIKNMGYHEWGGYEVFDHLAEFERCSDAIPYLNQQAKKIIKVDNLYSISHSKIKSFGFKHVKGLILNKKEGQIDTGITMQNLTQLAAEKGVIILNHMTVYDLSEQGTHVEVNTSIGTIKTNRVIVANNGFASELLKIKDVKPARAQVLITKPIPHLKLKGTFHYQEGFYYFRNVGNRVLLGGGRNLDFEKETTTEFKLNKKIHKKLDHILKHMILPNQSFEIDHRWCGIMGVGSEKKPIVKKLSPNIVCAVRMGGMGVAIGSLVGKMAVGELNK